MNQAEANTITINSIAYNLNDLEQYAWKKLVNGAIKKKNGSRTMCVATVSKTHECTVRTVVNRKADETEKKIFFYTDVRSRKFADLQNNNQVSLLFYDTRQNMQIAVKVTAIIHINNVISDNRWKATSLKARLAYMTVDAPNTKSDLPTLGYANQYLIQIPTEAESDAFKSNFAVIECDVHAIEFLWLHFSGNRKANFTYKNGVLENGYWAVP
ncbi:MAG: pyridoxamine 5'-phosphate oxidase family protein [Flavobacterium sp.]|nr:pyridoxamine 5'-phosphate oxidase family protein [Flavobacterium sp.]